MRVPKFSALVLACSVLLSACSPLYVMRAAYEESRILLRRQKIESILLKPSTSSELSTKLELVLKARSFAQTMGLTPKDSFTYYSTSTRDPLAWVIMASPPYQLSAYTWWFPFVGSVPYKGFFDKSDALEAAEHLRTEKGLEYWVRPTSAFSTLGWFSDPVLNTTLKYEPYQIVDTVIHECVHTTIWIDGDAEFNESLANFVGSLGSVEFFESEYRNCTNETCKANVSLQLNRSRKNLDFTRKLADVVSALYQHLETLYNSDSPEEVKSRQKQLLFDQETKTFRVEFPNANLLKEANNAEILHLKLYHWGFGRFESVFAESGSDWQVFLAKARKGRAGFDVDTNLSLH